MVARSLLILKEINSTLIDVQRQKTCTCNANLTHLLRQWTEGGEESHSGAASGSQAEAPGWTGARGAVGDDCSGLAEAETGGCWAERGIDIGVMFSSEGTGIRCWPEGTDDIDNIGMIVSEGVVVSSKTGLPGCCSG